MRLWDIKRERELRRFEGHTGPVESVAFSPDGRSALAGESRTVRVWDVQSGRQRHSFAGHTGGVYGVAVSPDGRFVLSGAEDRAVRLGRLPPR